MNCSTLSHESETCNTSPATSSTAFDTRPPDLPPAFLMDRTSRSSARSSDLTAGQNSAEDVVDHVVGRASEADFNNSAKHIKIYLVA